MTFSEYSVCAHVWRYTYVYMCKEARAHWVCLPQSLTSLFSETGHSLHHSFNCLTSKPTGIFLSQASQCWGDRHTACSTFTWVLRIQIQVLMLVQQALHSLSVSSAPRTTSRVTLMPRTLKGKASLYLSVTTNSKWVNLVFTKGISTSSYGNVKEHFLPEFWWARWNYWHKQRK